MLHAALEATGQCVHDLNRPFGRTNPRCLHGLYTHLRSLTSPERCGAPELVITLNLQISNFHHYLSPPQPTSTSTIATHLSAPLNQRRRIIRIPALEIAVSSSGPQVKSCFRTAPREGRRIDSIPTIIRRPLQTRFFRRSEASFVAIIESRKRTLAVDFEYSPSNYAQLWSGMLSPSTPLANSLPPTPLWWPGAEIEPVSAPDHPVHDRPRFPTSAAPRA